ncbi:hypothetical protein [Arsukibacterium sp.]
MLASINAPNCTNFLYQPVLS